MTLRLFLNVVYAWLVRNATTEDRENLDSQLYARADGGDDLEKLLMNLNVREG